MSDPVPRLTLGSEDLESVETFRRLTDTAVLTIMFTDIEGFTDLTDREGEEHSNRLRRLHDQILDGIITRGDSGLVVKRIGDAVMAVFAEPSTAVERALEIQAALDRFNEEHPELDPLRVRIGLDMGQVTVEEHVDADVFGRHVNRASRVEGLAAGGQVYMSYTVFDSARGWLGGAAHRLEWTSHGRFKLKGVADPVEVFEVVDPDRRELRSPRGGTRVRSVPGIAWAAGFVLLGVIGAVAYLQWEATEVWLSDVNVQSPYLDGTIPVLLDGGPENDSRLLLADVRPGRHVLHYGVADAVRYYAELDVQRGENRIRPRWMESRIPTLMRRIELGDEPVRATREGSFFVYGADAQRIDHDVVLEIALETASGDADADELVARLSWRLVLDGVVVADESRVYRNAVSTREELEDERELHVDEDHRWWADVRLVQRFAELDVSAAFLPRE
jgi:class 3 adenylate cyclase